MYKPKKPVTIDGLKFDALMSEERSLEATVPEYVVEEGFPVNDSIIYNAETVNMTLYVTDTPVTWKDQGYVGRVQDVCKKLEEIYFSGKPVTVVTTEKTYVNMAITSIVFSKSLETGYSREIPVSLKQVRVSHSRTTHIPASYGKSGKSSAAGGTASTSSKKSSSSSSSSSKESEKKDENKSSVLYGAAKSMGLV